MPDDPRGFTRTCSGSHFFIFIKLLTDCAWLWRSRVWSLAPGPARAPEGADLTQCSVSLTACSTFNFLNTEQVSSEIRHLFTTGFSSVLQAFPHIFPISPFVMSEDLVQLISYKNVNIMFYWTRRLSWLKLTGITSGCRGALVPLMARISLFVCLFFRDFPPPFFFF